MIYLKITEWAGFVTTVVTLVFIRHTVGGNFCFVSFTSVSLSFRQLTQHSGEATHLNCGTRCHCIFLFDLT